MFTWRKAQVITLEQVMTFSIGLVMVMTLLLFVNRLYNDMARNADRILGEAVLTSVYTTSAYLDNESIQNYIKIKLPQTSSFRNYRIYGMGPYGIAIELPHSTILLSLSLPHGFKGVFGSVESDDEYAIVATGTEIVSTPNYIRISPP